MPNNTRVSTASGLPAHLRTATVGGVADAPSFPPLPSPVETQRPPAMGAIGGIVLPIDPLLAMAGAYWNDQRQLVRKIVQQVGDPIVVNGRRKQGVRTHERFVAPPGMTLDQSRDLGLDFFSPQYGWIRGGLKREQEYVDNLGTGSGSDATEYVDAEAPDASEEV